MSEPCCMADAHGQACTCRERLYTKAELDEAVRAAYEDAAKVAVEMAGYASDENDHGVCMAVAATIRERGDA